MPSAPEQEIVTEFLSRHFGIGFIPGEIDQAEDDLIGRVLGFVANKFGRARYPLGLAIDFALLAQQLSLYDEEAKAFRKDLTKEAIFDRYARVRLAARRRRTR